MVRIKREERDQVLGQTRQRLLDAAAVEFARDGYQGANINTISLNAGYAKGTIYNYFPSKHDLLRALIDDIAQLHLDFIKEKVGDETNPTCRLELFFQAGFDFIPRYLPQARVMFNTIYGPSEELKVYSYQVYQPMFQFLAEILSRGVEQGVFRPMEPVAMAMLLMTIYLGTASNLDPQGRPWLAAAQVVDLTLNGLLK